MRWQCRKRNCDVMSRQWGIVCGGLTRDVTVVLRDGIMGMLRTMMMAVMVMMMVAVVCRRWFVDEIVPAFCG